jgi:hypothetical protein
MGQRSFFGLSEHLERLSRIGDLLEVLRAAIDVDYFRSWLAEGLGYGEGARAVVRPSTRSRCSRR